MWGPVPVSWAIAGKALGTGFTVGLDIDPVAVYGARRNLALNGLECTSGGYNKPLAVLVGGAECVTGTFHHRHGEPGGAGALETVYGLDRQSGEDSHPFRNCRSLGIQGY